ncbi:hypothetical protein A1O3_04090 [Capronia epimyces CBS 606.96]|uniref:Non-homologous end-joining factor 1 n=1 Tax=Capronia epimyces CBS 606.96 TaxID=1182542 RepID=W9Y2U6_9EURO|nr:uncharacterized protein A1O3_04090 [Capronia epimyces CBS 606.96]EXJ87132.1 hypothetical protein A1O3_04090 [Capronia epimyces CBS 606.96]
MTDSNNEGWQELQLPSRRQCPKLFYSLMTQNESIKLLLTDLISIWECSLDRYDILAEASRQHTSIDPSASSDQLAVLLSKIAKSLSDGRNVLVRANERGGHALRLKTSIDLPKPLRPLEWAFKLAPQPASELAERILRPSLHEVAVAQEKIESLLRIVRDKDHVISRLLERVDSSSIDLSLIFPSITGVASRKGGHISVTEARKHVPGMVNFNEKSWTKQFANDDGYEGADRTGLSDLVRGCEKCFVHTTSQHADWINGLPSSDRSIQDREKGRLSSPPETKAAARQPESGDESTASDDFERQATPPSPSSNRREVRKPANAASEDDVEGEEALSKVTKTSTSSLGRLNATKASGRSKARRDSSSSLNKRSPPPRAGSSASTATATPSPSDDNDGADSEPQPSRRQHGKTKTSNQPKLGGLRKKRQVSPSPTPSPSPSPSRISTLRNQSKRDEYGRLNHDTESSPRRDSPAGRAPSSRRSSDSRSAQTQSPAAIPGPDDSTATDGGSTSTGSESERTHKRKPKSNPKQDTRAKQSQGSPATTPTRRLGRLGRKPHGLDAGSPAGGMSQPSTKMTDVASPQGKAAATHETTRVTRARGGKDDDSDRTGSPSPSPSPSARSTTKTTLASHPRSTTSLPAAETARRVRPRGEVDQKEGGEEKQETEEQKADRRRLELKRTLAASTGTKKKRRF